MTWHCLYKAPEAVAGNDSRPQRNTIHENLSDLARHFHLQRVTHAVKTRKPDYAANPWNFWSFRLFCRHRMILLKPFPSNLLDWPYLAIQPKQCFCCFGIWVSFESADFLIEFTRIASGLCRKCLYMKNNRIVSSAYEIGDLIRQWWWYIWYKKVDFLSMISFWNQSMIYEIVANRVEKKIHWKWSSYR